MRVFVSYAQVPEDHKRQVRELVGSMRTAGLEVAFDGDVRTPQGPQEGWPRWMLDQVEAADWVLVVCNEPYYLRFRGKEIPGRGLGSRWEGAIIQQDLYGEGAVNRKFVPILLDDGSAHHIPEPLRSSTYYRCPADFVRLTAALKGTNPVDTGSSPVSAPSGAKREDLQSTVPEPNASEPEGTQRKADVVRPWGEIAPYAGLSIGSFLCGMVLVGLLLWKAQTLAALGLTGRFYYVVLLPIGLAVAAFLFGALRSLARHRGQHLGGALELGGPIVGFGLVILGGFLLPQPAPNFQLTVYVHGQAGPQDLVLKNSGQVLLDIGSDRRREPIGDRGQAFFPEIPASFQGQPARVFVDSDLYELANGSQMHRLDGNSIYLAVRKKAGRISGRVQDEHGNPLAGVSVTVADVQATTDAAGRFELVVSGDRVRPELSLQAVAIGFAPWHGSVVPHGNEVTVILRRQL